MLSQSSFSLRWRLGAAAVVVATVSLAALAQVSRTGRTPPASQPASRPSKAGATPARPAEKPQVAPKSTSQASRDAALRKINELQRQANSRPARPQPGQQTTSQRLLREQAARDRTQKIEAAKKRSEELRRQREARREAMAEAQREHARQNAPGAQPVRPGQNEPVVGEPNAPATTPAKPEPSKEKTPRNGRRTKRRDGEKPRGGKRTERPRDGARAGHRTRPPVRKTGNRPAAKPQPERSVTPARQPMSEEPAIEPPPPPADGRTEWFDFVNTPWEDVVKHYARRVGKPLMNVGDIFIGGELTYQTKRRFTKQEALDELNFLLVQQGFFMAETDDYVYVLPLNELTKVLDPDKAFYASIEEFDKANLRDMEFASVLIKIEGRPAKEVQEMLAPAMPDYAIPIVVGDTNQIQITGLARDVRRFMELYAKYKLQEYDPRQTRFVDIKTNVRDIERMVRDRFDVKAPQRQYNRQTRQWEMVGGEGNIKLIPDERTKTLIVRALPEKLDEISEFIKLIDKDPGFEFGTHVIEVKHGNAVEIANLLNEIFQQEQGRPSVRSPIRTTRTNTRTTRTTNVRTATPAPEDIIVEDLYERAKKTVRMVADPRSNTLIVYANKDGLDRVKEMLAKIDVPTPSNFRTFELQYAKAEEIQPIIEQFARGLSGTAVVSRGRTSTRRGGISVVADPSLNALHVVADREPMERIAAIIAELDVDLREEGQHIVRLANLTPSRVAQMVSPLLGTGGPIARSPRRGRPTRAAATSQLIPLDEAGILIVICSSEQWTKIEETIRIWDENALSDKPVERIFTLEHADTQKIVNVLQQLYRQYNHPVLGRSSVFVDALGEHQIIAHGVKPAIDEIEALLPSLDVVPQENPLVILPLEYADAQQVAELAQGLLPTPAGRSRRGRGAPAGIGASVTPEPVTNSLIIRADEATLERVKKFAAQMEDAVAQQQPERRFYTLKNATPRDVVQAITQLFGATGGRGRSRNAVGTQIKAVIVGNQVVVDAPAAKQDEIGNLVSQLDDRSDRGIKTVLVKMPGANVNSIAARLTRAFQPKVRNQGAIASFQPDVSTETILMTLSSDVYDEAQKLLSEFKELTSEFVWEQRFIQLKYAKADEAARWLRDQLTAQLTQSLGTSIARQIRVTGDSRTNKVIINAPQVAVKAGAMLLEQYDLPTEQQPEAPIDVWTVNLPGLDVRSLASQLRQPLDNLTRGRPDRLRATASADQVTNSLILSAPHDLREKVDELISKFSAQTADLTPVRKLVQLKKADANYIAGQLRNVLIRQIERQRGRGVAQQVSIQPDARLNMIIINAPKFAVEMAESLIAELDKEPIQQSQLHTIALKNADANTLLGVLNNIFREKIRAKTLQLSAEPLTNSIVVGGSKEEFADIETWVKDLDARAGEAGVDITTIDLKYADPWEVRNMINDVFGRARRRGTTATQQVYVTVSNNTLVVKAPPNKLAEVKALVASVDTENSSNDLQIKTYDLKVLNAQQVAYQVQAFLRSMGGVKKRGQMQPGAFAEPTTNSLVVIAPGEMLPVIETLIAQIESKQMPVSEARPYTLKNVRADQIARNVETMLRAKIAQKEGTRARNIQTAVMPETASNRLIVFAPTDYQDLVAEVIKMIDQDVDTGQIVHIIHLEQGNAPDMARTLTNTIRANLPRGAAPKVTVVADTSSNSLVLSGLPKDVAELETTVKELETNSATVPELQTFQLQYASTYDVIDTLTALFPQTRNPVENVTVTADDYNNRLIVTANKRKMRQVEAFIKQLDVAPEEGETGGLGNKEIHFVDIVRGDAWDIALDVSDLYPPHDRGGPDIDTDFFGEYIKVVCRPGEFDGILKNIRLFESKAKVERKWKEMKLSGDPARTLAALQRMYPDIKVDYAQQPGAEEETLVESLRPEGKLPPWIKKKPGQSGGTQSQPQPPAKPRRAAPGAADTQPSTGAGDEPGRAGVTRPTATLASYAQPPADEPANPIERRVREYLEQTYAIGSAGQDEVSPPEPQKEPVGIKVFPDGRIIMQGPLKDVEEIEQTIDVLESDLGVGQVIRIFKFTYGDVTQAARILDLMFNERQAIRLPTRTQVPQQQRRGQQGTQRGQQGGKEGQRGQQPGGDLATQLRQMMGQQPGGTTQKNKQLRIATDVGNNYLIVKCDESQLPEIRQLLRELDIPPGEVEVKVYQLHNIDAVEAADNIKGVLGISSKTTRGRTPQRPTGRTSAQQQILEALAQQQVAIGGGQGAKVESVEIVPNQITNSLLVSSPPDVLEIIERIINELEGLSGYDVVVIEDYPLANAKVDDVLPLLQSIFANATGGAGGRGKGARSPASLGPVSISGDPRSNTIIFSAQQKDVELVEQEIAKLDIEGAIAEAELYVCQFGDAQSIAQSVAEIFMIAGGRGRGGRGGNTPASSADLRISAEPTTNTILLFGPAEKRELVMAKIRELDMQASSEIHQIEVKFAKASKVAEMLLTVFGGSGGAIEGGGGGGRRGGRNAAMRSPGRVAIFGDDNAGKLLVRAPDPLFAQIADLAKTLDQPPELLKIRKYPLEYADAMTVVNSLQQGMMDYLQKAGLAGGAGIDFDPFTALPDPRTNSLIVIGSDQTFHFVEIALAAIDVPAPEEQESTVRIVQVPLKQDAVELAATIEGILNQGVERAAQMTGQTPNFYTVSADATTNTILVNGSKKQYDAVAKLVDQLSEIRPGAYVTRVVELHNLTSEEAQQIIDKLQQQRSKQSSGGSSSFRPSSGGTRSTTFRPSGSSRSFRPRGSSNGSRTFRPSSPSNRRPSTPRPRTPSRRPGGALFWPRPGTIEPRPSGSGPYSADSESGGRALTVATQIGRRDAGPTLAGEARIDQRDAGPTLAGEAQIGRRDAGPTLAGEARIDQRDAGSALTIATWPVATTLPMMLMQEAEPIIDEPPATQPVRNRARHKPRPKHSAGRHHKNTPTPPPAARPAAPAAPTPAQPKRPQPAQRRPAVAAPPAKVSAASLPSEALDSVSGQLQGEVYTVPLDSRRIAITGDEADLAFIEQMLSLMEATTPEGIIEIFKLENAKATAIQPIVEQTITAYLEQLGGQGRADRFSIIAEARSNSLIVTASETNMEMIRKVVNHLDEQAKTGPTDFESVPLTHIRAAEAVQLLQPVIDRLNQLRDVPTDQQASVEAVDRSNSLLVVGTQGDIVEIKHMIEAIDHELPEESDFSVGRILVMELKNAEAGALADTLNTLIELDRSGGGQSGATSKLIRRLLFSTADGRELPPLDLDKPIEIIPEKAKNSLIILSSPKNNESLKEIVSLFDQLPVGEDVEVKSLPLKYAQAEPTAKTLQDLFDAARENALVRPAEGKNRPSGVMPPQPPTLTGRGLSYNVHFAFDVRTNSVIAVGQKDALQLVGALVGEMDQPTVTSVMKPHLVQLRNKQASDLQKSLTDMLDQRAAALGVDDNKARDNAVIIPDDRSNTLVVLASDEVFGLVQDIATQLDQAESYRVVDSRFRRLEYADSMKLASLLQELFDRKKEAEQGVTESGQKQVLYVLSDSRSNSLMLTGTRDYLAEAEALITKLDQSFVPTLEFKVRPVMLNSAANIAARLQEMIDKTRSTQKGSEGTPIYVSAEPYSNTLLLAASREDMVMVERWVEVLDRPADPGRITRIIPLSRGDAEALATQTGELFQTDSQGGVNDITVTSDTTTNSVIAIGPPAVVKDIEDFLTKLDSTEPVDNAMIRIFKLEQADAETAGNLLRSVLELRGGTVSSGGGQPSGSSTSAQENAANQIMLVWQRQHPGVGTETLRALRSGITVIDNVRTNELFITAPPASMPLIESLVAAIDVPPDAAKIRIFPLRNSDAEEMVTMLEELFQTGQAAQTAGVTEEQQRVLQMEDMAAGGRQTLSFTIDQRTNSVIAAGTTGYLDLVEELILKLDTQDIQQRETLVVAPGNNSATTIQQMLQDFNDRQNQMMSDLQQELSVSERLRNEVVAVANEDTNRLILNFDPRRKKELLDLVRDLDQPPPQVMIQVLIAEVTLSDSVELGVEFAFQDLQFTKAGPTDTTTFDFVGGTDIGAAGAGLGGFTFTISGADFNFLLRTLQNESKLNVLSRPQIIAMDNLEARIEVTNDVPYVSGTQTSTTGQISTAVQRQDVGIILEVTPRINPDDFVRMHVRQEVSDLTDSTVDVGQGVTSPIFFKREAETDVTVKNNETVVLGGLISSKENNTEQKVPIIGDVPVLGLLFRNSDVSNDHTELLVVLTPRVIRTVEEYRDLSVQERDLTGDLPDSVVTSPLMQGLRVEPSELRLKSDEGLLEPLRPLKVKKPPEPVYGPARKAPKAEPAEAPAPSYDIPITGPVLKKAPATTRTNSRSRGQ